MSRALILDCDGVLADTERDGHLVAFNQTFEELGFPFRWSEDEYAVLLKIGGGKERMRGYLAAHPDIDLLTLKELGREPDEAVVVEDSESGAQAAANAGLRHVVTVSSFTGADPFPAATVVVSDLGEPGAPAQVRAGLDVRND